MSASTGRAEIHASPLHQCTDSARGKARDQVVQQVLLPRLPEDHPVHRERASERLQPEPVSAQGAERHVALDPRAAGRGAHPEGKDLAEPHRPHLFRGGEKGLPRVRASREPRVAEPLSDVLANRVALVAVDASSRCSTGFEGRFQ